MATGVSRTGYDAAAIDHQLREGMTLPAAWYADPAISALEFEHIFDQAWVLIGPEHRVAAPGSFLPALAGRVPVVVTRDLEGKLHAFVNVCRHRAHPVATEAGCRKSLQCRYHGWTYELDGRLRNAPRATREMAFDPSEWSLVPVAVETWNGFVLVNPDVFASPLVEAHPDLDRLAREHDVGFGDYEYVDRWTYDIPANWKVWVENATECYHCPTVHSGSFSDAFDTDGGRYQLIELGGLLCQFTEFNHKRRDSLGSRRQGDGFRFIFMFPSSFWAKDDYVAFTGMIVPTGVETCEFVADVYVRPGLDGAERDEWLEMYDRTLREDKEVVLRQQPGLRSNAIPYGRLLPRSESPIRHFHRLVLDALADAL